MSFLLFWKALLGRFVGTWIVLSSMWQFNLTSPETPGETPESWRVTATPLKDLAAERGRWIGAAVDPNRLRNDPAYAALVTREFNMLVAENHMKMTHTQSVRGEFTFAEADFLLDFAARHDMRVRGHTLVWHALPKWIKDKERDWDAAELDQIMTDHVTTVVGHFKGRVHDWDVVNEAVSGYFGLRRTVWSRTLGPDFIDKAFRLAHETDPDAKLFYNDFRVEGLNPKADRLYDLVKGMQARDVPIHGVGLQAHMHFSMPSRARLQAHLQRLADLGLEIHLTEVDLGLREPITNGKLIKQAIRYRRLLDACLAVDKCTAFVTWGVSDDTSWIPTFFKPYDAPLLFDADKQRKLAYFAVSNGLIEAEP